MLKSFFEKLSPCLLGLAFVHMWIYCSTHRFLDSGGVSVTAVLYTAMSCALVAIALMVRRVIKDDKTADKGLWRIDVIAAILMAIGGVALSIKLPLDPAVEAILGSILGGIGVAWAYGRWIEVYARLNLKFSAPLLLLTMAIGSACKMVIDFLPGYIAAPIFVCLPFATFACAHRSNTLLDRTPTTSLAEFTSEPDRYYNRRTIGSLTRVIISVAVFCLVIGIVRTSMLDTTPEPYVLSVLFNHLTEILIALVLFWWVAGCQRSLDFGQTWRIILILMVTVLMFEPLVSRGDVHTMLLALIRTAHALLIVFFLFLAVADVARHSSYKPLAVYCVSWLAYTLPYAVGNLVGLLLASSPVAGYVSTAAAWSLVVVALVLLDDRSLGNQLIFAELNRGLDEDAPEARAIATQRELAFAGVSGLAGTSIGNIGNMAEEPAKVESLDSLDSLHARCVALGRENGLTERETEVLELLARGHSKARIAETFLIAENTVRSHTKHIYAKLDVHSRQELLDLVESVGLSSHSR